MEKTYFTDLVPAEKELASEKLREWQRKFPASPLLNMFALKDPAARIPHRNRVRMLLTLPDKVRFDLLPLAMAPPAVMSPSKSSSRSSLVSPSPKSAR